MADLKLKIYNFEGKEVGTETLDPKLFGVEINPVMVQQMVVAQQKNARAPIAHTKGRAEVRGGGKKPWRQKGTGRARHGSSRSPIWSGGGITFGPTSKRNFSVKINKKVKAKALAMILSDKAAHEKIVVLESYNLPEAKTKMLVTALDKLPIKDRSALIATKSAEENIVTAAKNLPRVDTTYFGSFNVVDLLKYEYLVISKELLQKVTEHYL
jgi:large subunit ribosomal protein L4